MVMRIKVENQKEFNEEIKRISKGVSDLRPALEIIKKQWYQGNKSIFTLSGPGQYTDLRSDTYRAKKQRELGSEYPLLEAQNKRIKKAITIESDEHAYSNIQKRSIELGVEKSESFPYAFSIHYGSKKQGLVPRPYVLLGVEQVATNEIKKKPKVYYDIIKDFVNQVNTGKV